MPHPVPIQKERPLPELLAPAGSPQAFRAAIAAGADAVYLGGKQFGARTYAKNFTDDEIANAVASAHLCGVRLYVTVNTLVHDRELAAVGEYLIRLYSLGVDAVLVQDIGVAALARKIVPDLPLHASTQMTIHNAAGVRWAAGHGFSRVVVARELSLDEVERIARETADTGIGLEVFAHGALCYCYSGQCLMSSLIGGRSGNRGMCAQPCRKPYTLVTGQTDVYGRPEKLEDICLPFRYLLSPKDLCTYENLDRLVQSHVVSFKIEGRMRSPEYVATVVSIYRKALDAIASGNRAVEDAGRRDLLAAFNREFTPGYLFLARHGALMGRARADNRGLLIGRVTGFTTRSREVTLMLTEPVELSCGDGLFVCNPDAPEKGVGFFLNTAPRRKDSRVVFAAPRPVQCGDLVYLTSSRDLIGRAQRIIAAPLSRLRRPFPIDLRIQINNDGIPRLDGTIDTGTGNTVPLNEVSDVRFLPARTRPVTAEQIRAQMKKTGGTPFAIKKISLQYDGGMFVPIAELNRMRREFLDLAQKELVASFRPSRESVEEAKNRWATTVSRINTQGRSAQGPEYRNLTLSIYADRIEVVEAATSAGCDRIYFEPDVMENVCSCHRYEHSMPLHDQLMPALEICREAGIPLVWKLPRITQRTELEAILAAIKEIHRFGLSACMTESTGAADAVRDLVPALPIYGSAGLNIFNHLAVQELGLAFFLLTISPELSGSEIRELIGLVRAGPHPTRLELIVQGSAEAMISEDCLIQPLCGCNEDELRTMSSRRFLGLRDDTGRIFPARIDGSCRTHIKNSAETCLLDHIPYLRQSGLDSVAIDARGRTAAYASEMVPIYRDAISRAPEDRAGTGGDLVSLKKRIKAIAMGGITGSHFVRGLRNHGT
jgi:U32 family peptidase